MNNNLDLAEYMNAYSSADIIYISFPRAELEENSELRGTDDLQGKNVRVLPSKIEAIVFISLKVVSNVRKKKCLRTAYCLLRRMFSFECSLVRLYEQTNVSPLP